jgi:hypothetical protein
LNFGRGPRLFCGGELMAITFDPERGRILMCDYDMARVRQKWTSCAASS